MQHIQCHADVESVELPVCIFFSAAALMMRLKGHVWNIVVVYLLGQYIFFWCWNLKCIPTTSKWRSQYMALYFLLKMFNSFKTCQLLHITDSSVSLFHAFAPATTEAGGIMFSGYPSVCSILKNALCQECQRESLSNCRRGKGMEKTSQMKHLCVITDMF